MKEKEKQTRAETETWLDQWSVPDLHDLHVRVQRRLAQFQPQPLVCRLPTSLLSYCMSFLPVEGLSHRASVCRVFHTVARLSTSITHVFFGSRTQGFPDTCAIRCIRLEYEQCNETGFERLCAMTPPKTLERVCFEDASMYGHYGGSKMSIDAMVKHIQTWKPGARIRLHDHQYMWYSTWGQLGPWADLLDPFMGCVRFCEISLQEPSWRAYLERLRGALVSNVDSADQVQDVVRVLPTTVTCLRLVSSIRGGVRVTLPTFVRELHADPDLFFLYNSPSGIDTLVLDHVPDDVLSCRIVEDTKCRVLIIDNCDASACFSGAFERVRRLVVERFDHRWARSFPDLTHIRVGAVKQLRKDSCQTLVSATLTSHDPKEVYESLLHLSKLPRLRTVYAPFARAQPSRFPFDLYDKL